MQTPPEKSTKLLRKFAARTMQNQGRLELFPALIGRHPEALRANHAAKVGRRSGRQARGEACSSWENTRSGGRWLRHGAAQARGAGFQRKTRELKQKSAEACGMSFGGKRINTLRVAGRHRGSASGIAAPPLRGRIQERAGDCLGKSSGLFSSCSQAKTEI